MLCMIYNIRQGVNVTNIQDRNGSRLFKMTGQITVAVFFGLGLL